MKTTCPVCGKQIKQEKHVEGGRPKRFCSPRCRGIYHCRASQARKRGAEVGPDGHPLRPGRKCCVCGKEIDPRKPEGTVCCSTVCSQKRSNRLRYGEPVGDAEYVAFWEKRKAENQEKRRSRPSRIHVAPPAQKPKPPTVTTTNLPESTKTRVCPVCGKEFSQPARQHGYPKVYCSLRCRNRKNKQVYNEKRPSRAKVREPRPCECCGVMFVPKHDDAKYCSKRCGEIAYYARNREELREKERAYRATHPRSRNVAANKARAAAPNLTFVPKTEPVERDSAARVAAYLSLPAEERRARLDTLTKAEQAMARKAWFDMKCSHPVYYYEVARSI